MTPPDSDDFSDSPRSARTRRAVLDAAALLEHEGLAGTTIEAIHDRCGVSKTTSPIGAVDPLGSRLAPKGYGRQVIAALPRAHLTRRMEEVEAFFAARVE